MATAFTIGHSTRPIKEFIELLKTYHIAQLVDIRTVPGSRHNPQYGQGALKEALENRGIVYLYMKDLGGLRKKTDPSVNMGWRNQSFRNYADYMQTTGFSKAIQELIAVAADTPVVIMCAEAVPWRCHRSLVGDALLVRGIEVRDIMSLTNAPIHTMTSFARVQGLVITYPPETS